MFSHDYFASNYFAPDYFPPIEITQAVVEETQHGGTSREVRKRRKVYTTKDIYAALRKARERVDEIEVKPTISKKQIAKREKALAIAEQQVRERLHKQYDRVTGEITDAESFTDFVGALRFGKDLGEMPQEDMEQVLLVLLIDEWTDE